LRRSGKAFIDLKQIKKSLYGADPRSTLSHIDDRGAFHSALGTPVPHPELSSWRGGAKKAHPVAISPSVSDPERWRKRGEKLRTIAAEIADPNLRARLLRIADGYDLLAERAEQRAQTATEDRHESDD
jgi:hypothetical protein